MRAELERIRAYWDAVTPLYVEHSGTTFQAARLIHERPALDGSARELNQRLAAAAGLQSGQRVLDAGCGVCGPSIDIARACAGLRIDAITVSDVQARTAARLIRQAGLQDRVSVCTADYHALPFGQEQFDAVVFFESLCYTYDLPRLLWGVHQALRPGGRLFIKDQFKREGTLSDAEQAAFATLCACYALPRAITISEVAIALAFVGFSDVQLEPLPPDMSVAPTYEAFYTDHDGARVLNELGALHDVPRSDLPIVWYQVRARRPVRE